jgi:hypothetical protein
MQKGACQGAPDCNLEHQQTDISEQAAFRQAKKLSGIRGGGAAMKLDSILLSNRTEL